MCRVHRRRYAPRGDAVAMRLKTAQVPADDPPAETRKADPAGDDDGARFPVTRFLVVAAVLHVTAWLSVRFLSLDVTYFRFRPAGFTGDFLFDGWMHWDGAWYSSIAEHGYTYRPNEMSSVAFFPAYPLAMRVVRSVVPD